MHFSMAPVLNSQLSRFGAKKTESLTPEHRLPLSAKVLAGKIKK